jgi:hypothetical protein
MKANTTVTMPWDVLDRMERAVAKVRERLLKATAALNQAGIAYAVAGGNAVASWVASIDEGAVRNTRDIDLLVRRADLPAVTVALELAGFVPAKTFGVTMFLENQDAKPSESVHLHFANEKVRDDYPLPSPDVVTVDDPAGFRVLKLEELVQMELMADRSKERMHLQDLIGVGLIDQSWLSTLPAILAERLKSILDAPES